MPASADDHYACDPADCDQADRRSYEDVAATVNATETAEDAARRYARQLVLLEGGLTQRGIRPAPTAAVDTWAVELALSTIDETRAEADAIVNNLAKARAERDRAEARAGAYLLAHDHLAAVTRALVDRVTAWPVPVHSGTLDTVRRVLARDLETYLTEPYPDTRVSLTPEGEAAAAQPTADDEMPPPCQIGCGIGYHLQGCPHTGAQLGIAPDGSELASVPRVAREAPVPELRTRADLVTEECTAGPLVAILVERQRQLEQWGIQNHPDGTSRLLADRADDARRDCQHAASQGLVTWAHILGEEVAEAMAEEDPAKLRVELVQVAAVAAAWIEDIGRRSPKAGE